MVIQVIRHLPVADVVARLLMHMVHAFRVIHANGVVVRLSTVLLIVLLLMNHVSRHVVLHQHLLQDQSPHHLQVVYPRVLLGKVSRWKTVN
jgi:hypothetical protein